MPNKCEYKKDIKLERLRELDLNSVEVPDIHAHNSSLKAAKDIVALLPGKNWISVDGLPNGYPFEYEKVIIKAYIKGNGNLAEEYVREGCAEKWPKLEKVKTLTKQNRRENPVKPDVIGSYRDSQVLPAALTEYYKNRASGKCPLSLELTLTEAGPQEFHYYPTRPNNSLRVGILVSGGIAPGINAVISGIVKRQVLYAEKGKYPLEILGYPEGFKPLVSRGRDNVDCPERELLARTFRQRNFIIPEFSRDFDKYADEGGSILPSSRLIQLTEQADARERDAALIKIVNQLDTDQIDLLYVIGGDGSMKAAHAVWNYSKLEKKKLSIVAIPNTMDNDILWVWQSLGFQSAVEWAKGAIRQMFNEVKANPRVGIIQLFGTDSGFVVNHEALASGVCDLALTPEVDYTMSEIVKHVKEVLQSRFENLKSPYCIILMAENAIPLDAADYLDDAELNLSEKEKNAIRVFLKNNKRRVLGKTPDSLRTAGLKILSSILQQEIRKNDNKYWENFEVITSEPRHLIRSVPPSSSDIILGERLGTLAVDCGMAGYTDFMISQWLTEYVMVPLKLVVMGRKRVPKSGIFWKSVIAKTNQPFNLAGDYPKKNPLQTDR